MCEFGDSDVQGCDSIATCSTTTASWAIQGPTLTNCGSRPTGCPATRPAVPTGSSCTPNGLICDYVEARCECSAGSGGVIHLIDGSIASTWICPSPDTTDGCPARRPQLGSACSVSDKVSCDYGSCSIEGGTSEQCTGGVWVQVQALCPG